MISREKILELAKPILDERKFFTVSLTITSTNKIAMYLDGMDGVKISDCVDVSRVIEHGLNREEEDFELEVSSAGLNAPFTIKQQYLKNIGSNVSVQLSDGTKTEGKLIEANENYFLIECSSKVKIEGKKKKKTVIENKRYNYQDVNNVKLVISFK